MGNKISKSNNNNKSEFLKLEIIVLDDNNIMEEKSILRIFHPQYLGYECISVDNNCDKIIDKQSDKFSQLINLINDNSDYKGISLIITGAGFINLALEYNTIVEDDNIIINDIEELVDKFYLNYSDKIKEVNTKSVLLGVDICCHYNYYNRDCDKHTCQQAQLAVYIKPNNSYKIIWKVYPNGKEIKSLLYPYDSEMEYPIQDIIKNRKIKIDENSTASIMVCHDIAVYSHRHEPKGLKAHIKKKILEDAKDVKYIISMIHSLNGTDHGNFVNASRRVKKVDKKYTIGYGFDDYHKSPKKIVAVSGFSDIEPKDIKNMIDEKLYEIFDNDESFNIWVDLK